VALCNAGFQQQLVAMARQQPLLGAKPGTEESIIIKHVPSPIENDWSPAKRSDNPLDKLEHQESGN
jgi:hypothetical protein